MNIDEAEQDSIGHLDVESLFCRDEPLEVCRASDVFFYTMPASSVENSGVVVLSCCEASRVLLHELRWQDALVRRSSLNVDLCTSPGSLSAWGAWLQCHLVVSASANDYA